MTGGGYGGGYPGQQPYGYDPYQSGAAPPGGKPPKNKLDGTASFSGYMAPPPFGGYPPAAAPGPGGYPPTSAPGHGGYPPAVATRGGYLPSVSQPGGYPGGYPPAPAGAPIANPFATLVPSAFPPGTDPNVVACFQAADRDGSGFIDDKELQASLSTYNQSFSIRTVRLMMFLFTNSNARKIGPKEFTTVFYSLQNWRAIFERFDRDRSGKIDAGELRDALLSLGFSVSPLVLDLLISKYDPSGKTKAINYDNFIECGLIVKGLTEKFKERDTLCTGAASFTYEVFMLTVLPFLIA